MDTPFVCEDRLESGFDGGGKLFVGELESFGARSRYGNSVGGLVQLGVRIKA